MSSSETFINHDILNMVVFSFYYYIFFLFRLSSMIIHASVGVAFSVNAGAVEQVHMHICDISSRSLVTDRWKW